MTQAAGGYTGKLLRVNLTTRSVTNETIDEQFCRKHLGGAGFVTYFLLKELSPQADPLGPENKIVFANGPLTGIPLSGSGRNCVGGKSPLTGGIAKSEAGEFWGAELKRAGYDAVIVEGKAAKPVYIWIQDGEASIRDAAQLWGKNTRETQQAIRDELGDQLVRVALIGPAGENLVRYACIMNGLHDAAGRGGLGAVMGSKNLKAVAVRGHQAPNMVNPEPVRELREWLAANFQFVLDFHEFGTGNGMAISVKQGNLPVRNFRDGSFANVEQIGAPAVKNSIRVGMDGCFACTVRCKKKVQLKEPYVVDPAYGGPEYETLASLGSNCGIDNLAAIAKGNELCGAYSLDSISVGCTIAFAMECFENGLLTTGDTGGLDLKFGNHEAMLAAIELIARRKGIGDLLAEGTARAARRIGGKALDFAVEVKGLDPGMHDPRMKAGLGLGYMVNPHGADHCSSMHDNLFTKDGSRVREFMALGLAGPLPADDIGAAKANMFRLIQARQIMLDSLVLCQFLPYSLAQVTAVTNAVTGWNTTTAELFQISARTLTMARLLNIGAGLTAADDRLPIRFFQPKTDGALAEKHLDPAKFEEARLGYYSGMGWDEKGIPKAETLDQLGIPAR